jgi:hypothetical protein
MQIASQWGCLMGFVSARNPHDHLHIFGWVEKCESLDGTVMKHIKPKARKSPQPPRHISHQKPEYTAVRDLPDEQLIYVHHSMCFSEKTRRVSRGRAGEQGSNWERTKLIKVPCFFSTFKCDCQSSDSITANWFLLAPRINPPDSETWIHRIRGWLRGYIPTISGFNADLRFPAK